MRNPKRTAASASALMIGVGLIAFISIFASSVKASINASVDRSFAGDFVINSGAGSSGGGIDPALTQRLNTLPQVAAATGERLGSMVILGQPSLITAVDPRTAGQIFDVSPVQGSISALGADSIAVYKDDATKNHLTLGSPVSVVFRDTGPKTLRVALIYGDNQAAPAANPGAKTSYFLGTPAYDANFAAPHYDTQVFVKKAPGVTTAAALAAVKQLSAQYAPGTTVQDQASYKADQTKTINQLLALVYVLLALAIGAFFARRASRRLTTIHDTIAQIMKGDTHLRLPVRSGNDAIDKISRDVNLMLDEIMRLLVQIKGVGDNIAHDLRSPLAVVHAQLERGLEKSNDEQLRAVRVVGELGDGAARALIDRQIVCEPR